MENGHVYIAQPTLYKLRVGRKEDWIYNDAELDRRKAELEKNGTKYDVQRYKGLGEMNPNQLWDTTMDPSIRTLLQVSIEDAAKADETFDMLMGAAVPPRKKFIQTHAQYVQNLDV